MKGLWGLLLALAAQPALLACPICFQAEPNATTDGVRAAVIVLVAITTGVLTGFGVFVVKFARRGSAGA